MVGGNTPVSSAITNVSESGSARLFTSATGVSNLADVLTKTEVTFGNQASVTQDEYHLIIVPNLNATGPVFASNGTSGFQYNPDFDSSMGHYDADGNSLGGYGSYGTNEFTSQNYTTDPTLDLNSSENAYNIPSYTGGYTVCKIQNTGLSGEVTGGTTLTLTDDTNLANFRVGDVVDTQSSAGKLISYVPGSPDYVYDDAAGKSLIRTSPNLAGTFTDTFIADGPGVLILNMYAQGDDIPITLTTNNCTCSEPNNFTISAGGTVLAEFTFAGAGSFTLTAPSYAAAGYVMYYLDYGAGSSSYWTPSGGSQVTLSSTYFGIGESVSIADINEAAPSITTDGGTWTNGDTVTGPSFTTTGTVASTGSRTSSRAPVSSAITNVVSAVNVYSDDISANQAFAGASPKTKCV